MSKNEESIFNSGKRFVCERCVQAIKKIVEPELSFYDQVDFLKCFGYSGDKLSAGGGSEAAVTVKTSIGWTKFRECNELFHERKNEPIRVGSSRPCYTLA